MYKMVDRVDGVRVVPIVVVGGRVIENRGEETNVIKIEYEESFTEDFTKKGENQANKRDRNIDKIQLVNDERRRTIPIQISDGYSIKVRIQTTNIFNISFL